MIESNQSFIFAAYAITWVTLLGYVAHVMRGQRRVVVERERVARDLTGGRQS